MEIQNQVSEIHSSLESAPTAPQGAATTELHKPWPFTNADAAFAVIFYVIGYLYSRSFEYFFSSGMAVMLFVLTYASCVLLYMYFKKRVVPKSSRFWLAILLASGTSYLLWDNTVFGGLNSLFLHAVAIYWTMSATGALIENKTSTKLLFDALHGVFILPFCRFPAQIAALLHLVRTKNIKINRHRLVSVLCGVLLCIPMLGIVLPLLIKADETFANLFFGMRFEWPAPNGYLFTALPIGAYLFSLVYAGHTKKKPSLTHLNNSISAWRMVPNLSVHIVLAVLAAVYAVFVASATVTLVPAISGLLPSGQNHSQYAREGFFELCAVASFTVAVLSVAISVTKTAWNENRAMRILSAAVSGLSILLVITAIAKMGLYISKYGLTPKRFFTSIFMVFLALVFILIIVRTFKKINVVRTALCTFCVGFALLLCLNVSNFISDYNMQRQQNGTLAKSDRYSPYNFDDSDNTFFAAKPQELEKYRYF